MHHLKRIDDQNFNILIEGSGDPILFVHGFPLDHQMWKYQIEELSKTHQVIAPDLRGFGISTISDSDILPTEGLSMRSFASDLVDILDHLEIDQPVHLCGLSMGGYIAWQFAKHFRPQLRSLILCDTKAAADSEEAQQNRFETVKKVLASGSEVLAKAMPKKLFSEKSLSEKPDLIEETQSIIRSTAPQAIAAALKGMAARPDMTEELHSINVPCLIIVGEEDSITTAEEMRGISESIPNAKFLEVPNAGHMSPLEQPEIVNKAISEFLSEVGLG